MAVSVVIVWQYLQAFPSSSIPTNTFSAVRLVEGVRGVRETVQESKGTPRAGCGIPEVESDQ